MGGIRLELDRDGIRYAALTSPEVRSEIKQRAEAIAESARGATDDRIVVNEGGRSRARAYVTRLDSGARGEAKDRALGSSIDAAR
jgi:hypothetical protein